tara:strand:- start:566 stop:1663 length:1098 start_codon:yes stop_codon:yes gene_type:complete
MAGKDIKPKTETGLTRREALIKAAKTGAGAGALPSIVPDVIGGGLIDLVKAAYPALKSSSISQALANVTSSTQLMESLTLGTSDADRLYGVDQIMNLDIDDIAHGDDSLVSALENNKLMVEEDVAFMEAGHQPVEEDYYLNYADYFKEKINEASELESDILDNMTDLEIAFRDKYPDNFVDWLFKSPSGKKILSGTRRAIDEVYIYPGQTGDLPGETEFLPEDLSDVEEIEKDILPVLLEEAVKQFEIEKTEWDQIVDRVYKPDLKDLPEESSLEDIATIPTFRILRKALGKLGTPKPEAIEGPKPEAPKQIESKSPVQMANIASALSRFKRATPIGAAAAMYQPSPAGEGSDIVPPYPLIRPQF